MNALVTVCANDDTEALLLGLRARKLTAYVALGLFLAVWPLVFISTMIRAARR